MLHYIPLLELTGELELIGFALFYRSVQVLRVGFARK